MALCCIGGICIPYSAIIPLLIYGMKWTLEQLLKYGILPTSWGQYLLQQQPTKSNNSNNNSSTKSSCCNSSNSSSEAEAVPKQRRRGKQTKQTSTSFCSSTTATASCSSSSRGSSFNDEEDENVVIVKACETEDDWEDLLNNKNKNTKNVIICKFTAPWCKPCKKIQPLFEQLANEKSSSNNIIQFATVDADQLDDIAAEFGVMGLPCFVAIDNNTTKSQNNSNIILEKYTGSNPEQLRALVQRVEETTK